MSVNREVNRCYTSGLSFAAVQSGANEGVRGVRVGIRSAHTPTIRRAAYISGLMFEVSAEV